MSLEKLARLAGIVAMVLSSVACSAQVTPPVGDDTGDVPGEGEPAAKPTKTTGGKKTTGGGTDDTSPPPAPASSVTPPSNDPAPPAQPPPTTNPAPAGCAQERESNDTRGTANKLDLPSGSGTLCGTISGADTDWFIVHVSAQNGGLAVDLRTAGDASLTIMSPGGGQVEVGGSGSVSIGAGAGDYAVRLTASGGSTPWEMDLAIDQ